MLKTVDRQRKTIILRKVVDVNIHLESSKVGMSGSMSKMTKKILKRKILKKTKVWKKTKETMKNSK